MDTLGDIKTLCEEIDRRFPGNEELTENLFKLAEELDRLRKENKLLRGIEPTRPCPFNGRECHPNCPVAAPGYGCSIPMIAVNLFNIEGVLGSMVRR